MVPCYDGKQTLLFHHLKIEFGMLNNQHIKVDNVKAGSTFSIDEEDLMKKIKNEYKNHHVFIDEVGISEYKDILLLEKVARKLAHQRLKHQEVHCQEAPQVHPSWQVIPLVQHER